MTLCLSDVLAIFGGRVCECGEVAGFDGSEKWIDFSEDEWRGVAAASWEIVRWQEEIEANQAAALSVYRGRGGRYKDGGLCVLRKVRVKVRG